MVDPTAAVLITVGDHEPIMPLRDTVPSEGAGALTHNGPMGLKAGGIFPKSFTTSAHEVATQPVI